MLWEEGGDRQGSERKPSMDHTESLNYVWMNPTERKVNAIFGANQSLRIVSNPCIRKLSL